MIRWLVNWWIGARGYSDRGRRLSPADRNPAVVVTGGSSGIGQSIARVFAGEGGCVVLVARSEGPLSEAAEQLRQTGDRDVRTLSLDITTEDAPEQLMSWLEEQGLYCDILVNNAAIGAGGAFWQEKPGRLRTLAELNVRALTDFNRAFLPQMIKRKRGGILNMSSLGGMTPGPYQAAYYASKAYVISLTEALAWELRGEGVRMTCVAPGPVETEFHDKMNAESAFYRRFLPAHSPEHVARVAVSAFWSGRTTVVPGLLNTFMSLVLHLSPPMLSAAVVGFLLKPREGLEDAGHSGERRSRRVGSDG